jgi:CheY-like chemotaxis protein
MQNAKPSGRSRKVLVVDDDADTAETLGVLIRLMGHEARCVTRSSDALDAAKSLHPDIAFVDLGMPKIDGYALAQLFRATPELKQIVLVAVSGHGRPEDRARSRHAGFDAHVLKPVDAALVESILAQFNRWLR